MTKNESYLLIDRIVKSISSRSQTTYPAVKDWPICGFRPYFGMNRNRISSMHKKSFWITLNRPTLLLYQWDGGWFRVPIPSRLRHIPGSTIIPLLLSIPSHSLGQQISLQSMAYGSTRGYMVPLSSWWGSGSSNVCDGCSPSSDDEDE
jgi:hypothetical protein